SALNNLTDLRGLSDPPIWSQLASLQKPWNAAQYDLAELRRLFLLGDFASSCSRAFSIINNIINNSITSNSITINSIIINIIIDNIIITNSIINNESNNYSSLIEKLMKSEERRQLLEHGADILVSKCTTTTGDVNFRGS
ncbi:hypothetical protein STEG23_013258, partial [Scotinomys teguina]